MLLFFINNVTLYTLLFVQCVILELRSTCYWWVSCLMILNLGRVFLEHKHYRRQNWLKAHHVIALVHEYKMITNVAWMVIKKHLHLNIYFFIYSTRLDFTKVQGYSVWFCVSNVSTTKLSRLYCMVISCPVASALEMRWDFLTPVIDRLALDPPWSSWFPFPLNINDVFIVRCLCDF